MFSRLKTYLLFCLIAFVLADKCPAAITWTPDGGFESEGALDAGSARDTLELAKKLELQKKYGEALKAYRTGARKYPNSFSAAELYYGWGRMVEIENDFTRAFKTYQVIVERYPNSEYYDKALERQFQIGNLYLAGERERLWKIPTLPSMQKTVQYFEQIVKSAPYSRWAPEAQFKIGVALEKQKKYAEAVKAYQKVINKYPNLDIAALAQYQIGYAWMGASSTPEYDQSAATKAIEAFEDFMTRYPNNEKVAQAEQNITKLKGNQNQGSMNIAKFYDKAGDMRAAIIYYNEVIQENPDSENARLASKRIDELNKKLGKNKVNLEEINNPLALPVGDLPTDTETQAQKNAVQDALGLSEHHGSQADSQSALPQPDNQSLPSPDNSPLPDQSTPNTSPSQAPAPINPLPSNANGPPTPANLPEQ
ncbi:MAG: outer membrane protein assembly factor BamD [Verrucomicrobiota bacterium]|nr:outer membrane protein assembly factor BamD [Verrucomicrobiota bacterium]